MAEKKTFYFNKEYKKYDEEVQTNKRYKRLMYLYDHGTPAQKVYAKRCLEVEFGLGD